MRPAETQQNFKTQTTVKKKKIVVKRKKIKKNIGSMASTVSSSVKKRHQEGEDDFDSENSVSQLDNEEA